MNWIVSSLQHFSAEVYTLTAALIYMAMSAYPDLKLLVPFVANNDGDNILRVQNQIYIPPPYICIFLGGKLTPAEAWTRLWGSIMGTGAEVDCCPIIDWIQVSLTQKSSYNQPYLLAISRTSTPLMDGYLLFHRHNTPVRHILVLNSSLQCAQVYLIVNHVREVAVKLCLCQKENTQQEGPQIRWNKPHITPPPLPSYEAQGPAEGM